MAMVENGKTMKLCFVVHRYAPFPGGSEYYVQWMAEECVRRGHDVTVFTGKHGGDLNGVRVTSDGIIFNEPFDLIVVHGGDVYIQNAVLSAIPRLTSPVLYLIIKPSNSQVCQLAMNHAAAIGCSTHEDWDHAKHYDRWLDHSQCVMELIHSGAPVYVAHFAQNMTFLRQCVSLCRVGDTGRTNACAS